MNAWSLLLALISLLSHVDCRYYNGEICIKRVYGSPGGSPVRLGRVPLNVRGAHSYEIVIPSVCQGTPTGLKIKACDHNKAPSIYFKSYYDVIVTRNDGLRGPAYVTVTIYCQYDIPLLTESNTPKLSVKVVSSSDQDANNEGARLAYNYLQTTRNSIQSPDFIETYRNLPISDDLDNRQATDVSRNVLAIKLQQARNQALGQIDEYLYNQSADEKLFNVRLRLGRSSSSTDTKETEKAAETSLDAKVDKMRQAAVDQVYKTTGNEHAMDKINKNFNDQKRQRRSIQYQNDQLDSLDASQARKSIQDILQANRQQDASSRAQHQTVLEAARFLDALNGRQIPDVTRNIITAQQKALLDANRAGLIIKSRQVAELPITATAFDDDAVRQAILNEERMQNILEQSRIAPDAYNSDVYRSVESCNDDLTSNLLRTSLNPIYRQVSIEQATDASRYKSPRQLYNRLRRSLKTSENLLESRQSAENVRKTIDIIKRQSILDQNMANNYKQTFGTRQATDRIQQSIVDNMRQQNVKQAQKQALEQAARQIQLSSGRQDLNTLKSAEDNDDNVFRNHITNKARQAIINDQVIQGTRRLDSFRNLEDGRADTNAQQVASIKSYNRQALNQNQHLKAVLDNARVESVHDQERRTKSTRKAADVVEEALSALADRQSAMDEAHNRAVLKALGQSQRQAI